MRNTAAGRSALSFAKTGAAGHREELGPTGCSSANRWPAEWQRQRDPVFASMTRTPLSPSNFHSRILNPTADAAGVPGIGFHAFRHTRASILIDEGRSIVQVSRWLGARRSGVHVLGVCAADGLGDRRSAGAENCDSNCNQKRHGST
jgi:hypothetical protein